MRSKEAPTKLIQRFTGARSRQTQMLATLGVVAVIAASCGSDAATVVAEDVSRTAPEIEDATTTTVEVEETTTTTAEPEPEPDSESEPNPAPDTAVADFTAAFGVGDVDKAWSFHPARCTGGMSEPPADFTDWFTPYALANPGLVASNISADIDGDTAAVSYDTHNGSGEFVQSYTLQPWVFIDGSWYRDC